MAKRTKTPSEPKARLTETDKSEYVKNGYTRCPYCDSNSIEGGSYNGDGNTVTQDVTCLRPSCGRSWTDVYTLTEIETKDPPDAQAQVPG